MKASRALRQSDILEFIGTLFGGDLHAKRVLSLANGTLGVLTSASLAVHAIGQGLAHAQGTLSKHGVKQVDRLLSNQGIEVDALFERWVPYVIGARKAVVVAMDWTSFAGDGHETLVLSMLTRHGRATPLLWRTVEAKTLKGQQSAYEDALLCRLHVGVFWRGLAVVEGLISTCWVSAALQPSLRFRRGPGGSAIRPARDSSGRLRPPPLDAATTPGRETRPPSPETDPLCRCESLTRSP